MKKVYAKVKILANGMFPIDNYKIDDFSLKTSKYNEKMIDTEDEDYIFYSGSYLMFSCYSLEGEEGINYNYFENDQYIEIEIDDTILDDKRKLSEFLLDNMCKRIENLERKMRLITNISVGLPIFMTKIYDSDDKYITQVGFISHKVSLLNIANYDENMKKTFCTRLGYWISDSAIEELENKDSRYRRALTFYNESFLTNDIGVRFTLLFSSLESLFNLTGKSVKYNVSKYSSKILFENTEKEKEYYDKIFYFYRVRSSYIHGNEPIKITDEMEFELRKIVREILWIYWNISYYHGINSASDVIKFLDKNNQTTIDLQLQAFKKYLHVTSSKTLYEEIRHKLLSGKTNILVNN